MSLVIDFSDDSSEIEAGFKKSEIIDLEILEILARENAFWTREQRAYSMKYYIQAVSKKSSYNLEKKSSYDLEKKSTYKLERKSVNKTDDRKDYYKKQIKR